MLAVVVAVVLAVVVAVVVAVVLAVVLAVGIAVAVGVVVVVAVGVVVGVGVGVAVMGVTFRMVGPLNGEMPLSKRVPLDAYDTPSWCVQLVAPYVMPRETPAIILDPCAGTGGIFRAIASRYVSNCDRYLAIEVDPVRGAELRDHTKPGDFCIADALGASPWPKADLIITNPPYKLALPFVERALTEVRDGGTVAMLLRLNFLGSQRRANFWMLNPCEVYVLSRRPSFTVSGKGTDRTEYAWFVWGPGRRATWKILGP